MSEVEAAIRRCRDDERPAILAIVNAAAEAYRGVIPADRWHEPYMPAAELDGEIAAGVEFWGYEADSSLAAIMGPTRRLGVCPAPGSPGPDSGAGRAT